MTQFGTASVAAPTQPNTIVPFVESAEADAGDFAERRGGAATPPGVERRQFAASRTSNRPAVNELAEAIDAYKLANRRRFITIDELFDVVTELGYTRD